MKMEKMLNNFIYMISTAIGKLAVQSLNSYSWVGMYKMPVPESLKNYKKNNHL